MAIFVLTSTFHLENRPSAFCQCPLRMTLRMLSSPRSVRIEFCVLFGERGEIRRCPKGFSSSLK